MMIRRPRSRAKRTRKQTEDPDPDDPALNGQPPATTPTPDPALNDPAFQQRAAQAQWLEDLEKRDPITASHIKELRQSDLRHRMRSNELKEEVERLRAESNASAAAKRAEQERELLEQGQHKTIAEQRAQDVKLFQMRAIKAELKAGLLAEGIDPEHIEAASKLIETDGIIAAADGSIVGIDNAIGKFKEKNEKLLPALMAKQTAPAQGAPDPAASMPGAGTHPDPLYQAWLTRMHGAGGAAAIEQMRNMGAAAKDLPVAPAPNSKPIDMRKATPEQADDYFKKLTGHNKKR